MKKRYVYLASLLALTAIVATGCKKKDEGQATPVEETLTAVSVNDLQSGSYYVKNGSDFYVLPSEGISFDVTQPAKTTSDSGNGMITNNRIVDFVYKDDAIPTLYKNDQLVFKSSGNVPSFTWERFLDQGYSIGFYNLQATGAGKVQFDSTTSGYDATSSAVTAVVAQQQQGYDISNGFVIDKINGTLINQKNLRTGGIIAGLTKNAAANCDLYIGTNMVSIAATADTRYFTSFELFTTAQYNNSPDGYAIVEVPDYLKSGYYLINNAGLVKYLAVDRGTDTTDLDTSEPYYYKGKNGQILTYYEYMEEAGKVNQNSEVSADTLGETDDIVHLNTDATQNNLSFSISYKYHSDEDEAKAKQDGSFPKIVLISPTGTATQLATSEGSGDNSNWHYANSSIDGAVAGAWELRFYNFENIYRTVTTDVSSGNARTFVQNGDYGTLNLYMEASASPNDFTITWQNKDRAAEITIKAPDGTKYTADNLNSEVIVNEYGRIVYRVPSLQEGNYIIDVKGSGIGRVWVDNKSVISDAAAATQPAETEAPAEAEPAQ